MATIEKRGQRWRVRVRKDGVDISESFRLKSEAQAWAAQREADISSGKLGRALDRSFGDLLHKYLDEVSINKDGVRWERVRIHAFIGAPGKGGMPRVPDPLSQIRLPQLGPEHFAAWRDRRLKEVSVATVLREWNLLSAVCTRAVKEWRWMPTNPMSGVSRPAEPPPRTRRISQDEIDKIIIACGYSPNERPINQQERVAVAFLFAIEIAMRAGEICALRWSDLDGRVIRIAAIAQGARKTKSSRTVPLSTEASKIIEQMRGINADYIFALKPSLLDALFRKAKNRAMIEDLHFHDTRAEALTRLSKKVDVMQLARISGHKDIRILYNVYYREKMEDIVHLLN